MSGTPNGADELAEAHREITRQQEEINDLRARLSDEEFGSELHRIFSQAKILSTIGPPLTYEQLLRLIVETAARVINASAGSFLLLDEDKQDLVVEHPLGPRAQEVDKLRVPLGHGIAGLVAASGQPMSISDARNDPRQAADIAERVGYWPNMILCVPLMYQDRIIGVLELLDKQTGEPFSQGDLQTLSLFANLASVAVDLWRNHLSLTTLISSMMQSLGATREERVQFEERASAFEARSEPSFGNDATMQIAALVREISDHGQPELDVCKQILESFAGYLRSREDNTLAFLTSR